MGEVVLAGCRAGWWESCFVPGEPEAEVLGEDQATEPGRRGAHPGTAVLRVRALGRQRLAQSPEDRGVGAAEPVVSAGILFAP